MKKLFIPYPIAVLAKAKGFNEPCIMVYHTKKFVAITDSISDTFAIPVVKNKQLGNKTFSAPLYEQITNWLRVEHNLWIEINVISFNEFRAKITAIDYQNGNEETIRESQFINPQEAYLEAFYYILKELI